MSLEAGGFNIWFDFSRMNQEHSDEDDDEDHLSGSPSSHGGQLHGRNEIKLSTSGLQLEALSASLFWSKSATSAPSLLSGACWGQLSVAPGRWRLADRSEEGVDVPWP